MTGDAPLLQLPLFLRAGGVIPMLRPTIDTLAPVAEPDAIDSFANDSGRLWARVAAGADGQATVYDGAVVRLRDDGRRITLEMTPGAVFGSGMGIELIGLAAPPAAVRIDSTASDAWSWDGVVLTVPAAATSIQVDR